MTNEREPAVQKHTAHKVKKVSVFRRVALPFVAVAIIDCALLILLLLFGGTFTQMHDSGLTILSEVTFNKYVQLEDSMLSWAAMDTLGTRLCDAIQGAMKARGQTRADMALDPSLNAALADACKELLADELRVNDENGIFLVLDGIGVPGQPDSYGGLYLYDAVPTGYHSDNSDMSLLRGLPPLSRSMNITLHSFWQASFTFPGGAEDARNDYFFQPLQAYRNRAKKDASAKHYGYWSPAFHLDDMDGEQIVTYSRALAAEDGTVYGVYGISVNLNRIQSVLAASVRDETISENCFYLGVTTDGGKSYRMVTTAGRRFTQNFIGTEEIRPMQTAASDRCAFVTVEAGRTGAEFCGAVYPLHLYSANTPFLNMEWHLIGLRDTQSVFSMEREFTTSVALVVVIGLVIGLLIALRSASGISRPISRLVKELRGLKNAVMPEVEDTGINEVDELAGTIMQLSRDAVEEASRISRIITLSELPFGAFEKHAGSREVFCSAGFFKLLNCDEPVDGNNRLPVEAFDQAMASSLTPMADEGLGLYSVRGAAPARYIRMRKLEDANGVTGTLLDVTEEVEKRRRIERERDYDLLTGLYNRRAFERQALELFSADAERLKPAAALVMVDLDNLKAVNDSYGHDSGDVYIRRFAEVLHENQPSRCLVGRRSGDEFFLFFYGYPNREAVRQALTSTWEKARNERVLLADGVRYRLRASAGIAWYPEDSASYEALLRYADFAMYRAKGSLKGGMREFDQQEYNQEGYMVNGIQALNRMLEHNLVNYAFQPIVSATDGSALGYELLMRPAVEELPNPQVVLRLAREQGRLEQVETMTLQCGLAAAREFRDSGALSKTAKLFINSIANQLLPREQEAALVERFRELMPQVVVEITENESAGDDKTRHKVQLVRANGGGVAIDDFGTGYNSDLSLIEVDTDYVKIDMSFVRNVHLDGNKQALIANTVQYAHHRGIQIIGEGVENRMELETLSRLGVDYFQGYYLARPALMPPAVPESVVREIRIHAEKRGATRPSPSATRALNREKNQ